MSSLLIKIRKSRWYKPPPVFVPEGDVAADCLTDLRVSDNALSVWLIEESNANLDRVVTALAANSDHVDNIDYLLFDDSIITRLGVKVRNVEGETPDASANRQWHRDLIELTGRTTLDLAIAIYNESTTNRVLKATILERLTRAVANSEIDISKLKSRIAETLRAKPV